MRRVFILAAVCFVGRVGYGQLEPVPVIDIDPGTDVADPPGPGQFRGFNEPNFDGVWGWNFTVDESIVVTHLAWFDDDGDGLSHEHELGIWQDMHDLNPPVLLFSDTIPAGDMAELVGPWRRISIPPTVLDPGFYLVGGLDNEASTDVIKFVDGSRAGFPLDPRVSFVGPAFDDSGNLEPPLTSLLGFGAEFGPTFFVEPIPEPSTLTLFGIAIVVLAVPHRNLRWGRPRMIRVQ